MSTSQSAPLAGTEHGHALGRAPRGIASSITDSRIGNRTARYAIDLVVLSGALWMAYGLRFDWELPPHAFQQLLTIWPWVIGLQWTALMVFRVPKFSWRLSGLKDSIFILQALSTAALLLIAVRLLAGIATDESPLLSTLRIPLSITIIATGLAFFGLTGVRILRRLQTEAHERNSVATPPEAKQGYKVILVGAGRAGMLASRELHRRPDSGLIPVAFVDDDPIKQHTLVDGLPVAGAIADLPAVAKRYGASRALISVPNLRGDRLRKVVATCEEAGLRAKTLPPLSEVASGKVRISQIRDVAIEDLLGRNPVVLDQLSPTEIVTGRTVIVTGAGGSIGSELCRQILHSRPARLLLVERAENALYTIHHELCRRPESQDCEVLPQLADITDLPRMRQIFDDFRPDLVFHAAAHKHVPMMEANPREALKNNALGTLDLSLLADEFGCNAFVLISTDKAVKPSSVMGATKRLAELGMLSVQRSSKTRFVAVRFGNVLGSAGSVIPLFRRQIQQGGPLTVTHPEMVRFFMTIPEAVHLVLEAATIGKSGDINVLDMGEPIKIRSLAEQMIRLSGLEPGEDIEIHYSGVRPGEKLYEELVYDSEELLPTSNERIRHLPLVPSQYRTPEEIRSIADGALHAPDPREQLANELPDLRVQHRPATAVAT